MLEVVDIDPLMDSGGTHIGWRIEELSIKLQCFNRDGGQEMGRQALK
jgi:hypothetical protein